MLFVHSFGIPANGFHQYVGEGDGDGNVDEADGEGEDIEAQIRKEVDGLKPNTEKPRRFSAIRLEVPCGSFFHILYNHTSSVIVIYPRFTSRRILNMLQ